MKRPQSIRIFGKPFGLIYAPNTLMSDAVGLCRSIDNKIVIQDDLTPAEELDTVVHELLHAVAHVMCIPFGSVEQEEAAVRALGTGLCGVILDNPAVLKYFAELSKKVDSESREIDS